MRYIASLLLTSGFLCGDAYAQQTQSEQKQTITIMIVPQGGEIPADVDPDAYLAHVQGLAEQGDADAQYYLGALYLSGQNITRNFEKASTWLDKAADQNQPAAQTNLGLMLLFGHGTAQDHAQAAYWFNQAAKQSFAEAQNALGMMYKNGQGVDQNDERAVQLFHQAATQGFALGQDNLGVMYQEGRGIKQDDLQALLWFLKAARQDLATAHEHLEKHALTALYNKAHDADQSGDHARAFDLFKQSAHAGDPRGQYTLATMYDWGEGTTQDYVQAPFGIAKLRKMTSCMPNTIWPLRTRIA
ncbi:MAG: tetratricopeptide repeat protein [Pseudomonadota bacterium]